MTTGFQSRSLPLSSQVRAHMQGRSWHSVPDCPGWDTLSHLQVTHHGMDGSVHWGELVVASGVVGDLLAILQELFELGFPIERMQRVDCFDGDDERSMAANNSSAFNFRTIAGSDRLSHHALGVAIDLNPRTNPMFVGDRVQPACGLLKRDASVPGVILDGGPVVQAFLRRGWYWGGHWPDVRDTHHFSALARCA